MVEGDLKTGVIVVIGVLVALFIFTNFMQQPIKEQTKETTGYDVTKYLSKLNKDNKQINEKNTVLQDRLDYLETTDLVKENDKLRQRIHPVLFFVVFMIAMSLMCLVIMGGLELWEKKRDIKRFKEKKEDIKKITEERFKKNKDKIKEIKEMIEWW